MPATKTSKTKKVKAGKGKKDGKQDSKTDKESDVEKAKDNAALWELRLKVTNQSLAEYQKAHHQLSVTHEELTSHLYRKEKDTLDMTEHWERQVASRDHQIRLLEESLRSQEALYCEEKSKLIKDISIAQEEAEKMKEIGAQLEQELNDTKHNMRIAEEEHKKQLHKTETRHFEEKARLEKDMTDQCNQKMALVELDHREATAQLEAALQAAFKERDCLMEALRSHKQEVQDLQKLSNSLAEENMALALDKDMLELTVKENAAQTEAQRKKQSELRSKVASLKQALQQQAAELERREEEEKAHLVSIQAGQVELDKLQKVLAMREKELGCVAQLASAVEEKHGEVQEFFHEALAHVRQQIAASRCQYKKEALKDYRLKFREATAGKTKFPPVRTFHKSPHSTNSVYSDMEAASTWTYPPGSKVRLSDLTWEQKEQVLQLLFAKMNGLKER
ncbi:basal body-orientation factor 1-like [Salarias fasciatus]|uniref:basal body-orientation factor 1-like n=1 Tax=Salarias fasciatus TaxID=181472 RepID=UPI0011769A9B|nr:basal body-orientation factor 1 [Salarias fasciatus]